METRILESILVILQGSDFHVRNSFTKFLFLASIGQVNYLTNFKIGKCVILPSNYDITHSSQKAEWLAQTEKTSIVYYFMTWALPTLHSSGSPWVEDWGRWARSGTIKSASAFRLQTNALVTMFYSWVTVQPSGFTLIFKGYEWKADTLSHWTTNNIQCIFSRRLETNGKKVIWVRTQVYMYCSLR